MALDLADTSTSLPFVQAAVIGSNALRSRARSHEVVIADRRRVDQGIKPPRRDDFSQRVVQVLKRAVGLDLPANIGHNARRQFTHNLGMRREQRDGMSLTMCFERNLSAGAYPVNTLVMRRTLSISVCVLPAVTRMFILISPANRSRAPPASVPAR